MNGAGEEFIDNPTLPDCPVNVIIAHDLSDFARFVCTDFPSWNARRVSRIFGTFLDGPLIFVEVLLDELLLPVVQLAVLIGSQEINVFEEVVDHAKEYGRLSDETDL